MILITGATGNFGNVTIDFLLEKGARLGTIAALVSHRKKAADLLLKGIIVRIGDYDNYASLVDAFEGVDKLVLVAGTDLENRVNKTQNTIKAAQQAGVKHIFYTRFDHKDETENIPLELVARTCKYTEKVIRESLIPYTIFRNTVYSNTLPFYSPEKVWETGIVIPTAETTIALTLRNYMAAATANLLMSEGHENKEYYLPNIESLSSTKRQLQ
jgi:NAD(P)H dehydrogenase (quinone)